MTIGIDIGSTATKAVSLKPEPGKAANGENVSRGKSENAFCNFNKIKTQAEDPITAASGALGKIIAENGIDINTVKQINITGVGAAAIPFSLFGIPVRKVSEISAIGRGGMFLSGREKTLIANIGTGTAIVAAAKEIIEHAGGTGMGGGTILGLGKKMLGLSRFADIMALAERGDLGRVDFLLEDVTQTDMGFLNPKATASNFGKMLDTASPEDIALGIVSMVYQVIGTIAVFAAKSRGSGSVVVTGNGSNNSIGKSILNEITRMYQVAFEYPENGEYATALGAGLFGLD